MFKENRLIGYNSNPQGGVGDTVEVSEIESLASRAIIIGDGVGAPTTLVLAANAYSLISAADYAAMKALLDLEIGTDVQAYHALLAAVAAGTYTGDDSITTVGTLVAGNATAIVDAATTSAAGKAEASVASEVNTGTDATRYVSPDSLAGSNLGTKVLEVVAFDYATAVATGDGKAYVTVPSSFAGMDLVACHARVITAGTTNSTTIQIHNLTQAADMLSALLEVETGETGSNTSDPGPTIDTGNDDVAAWDVLRVDVDTVSTTPPQGLIITLEFRLP